MANLRKIDNRYTINHQIGSGGMGTVFLAKDTETNEDVALKLLKSDAVANDPGILTRFEREAEALRSLNHPNIVKVLGTVSEDNNHYIVMEYVSGGALNTLLKSTKLLPVDRILKIAIELADALTRAHYLQIVHRDIKPANVLIAEDGTPRLTDFGVAYIGTKERITQVDVAVGTPDYMSPEALNGQAVDARADIWSFGVMLFEMLAGAHPFAGDSIGQVITSIISEPTPDLEALRTGLPVALVDLVYRMLEKDPTSRIPSIRLVGAELEVIMQGGIRGTSTIYATNLPQSLERFATPTPTPGKAKHNLPAQTTPFVGRKPELQQIHQLLDKSDVRLVTIIAPGGMGKSRISLEAAHEQLYHFVDGVFFVTLAPLNDPDEIVTAIAESVGYLFQQDGRSPKEQLIDFLQDKNLLLLMDNFENVIDGAVLIGDILVKARGIKVLATSRERLRLSGETVFTLDGMAFPDLDHPEDALEYSSVKLFVQGAQRVSPGFTLEPDDLPYVIRICQMVQGMPLGILLAAGWAEMLSLEEIVEEMSQSLDFLETDIRDVPERHRSIRAVFDYSWNLMNGLEQEVFIKLSVFRGGFEREAAQKVAGATLRTLTTLTNKSLLTRTPEGRYWVHKLLQQYAEEQFDDYADRDDIQAKHAQYYSAFMDKLQEQFSTRRENAAVEVIDREHDNIRLAWRWGIENRYWEHFDKMVQTAVLYYLSHSMLTEGNHAFDALADGLEADGQGDSGLYWKAKSRAGWLAGRQGNYDLGWTISRDVYEHFKNDDAFESIQALNNMSYACMFMGRYSDAIEFAKEGARLSVEINNQDLLWGSDANRGYAEYLNGDYEKARQTYEEILELGRKRTEFSRINLAFGLNNLGEIHQVLGKFREAKALFQEAYDIFKVAKHRRGMAFTLNNLGGICFVVGEHKLAEGMYSEAYAIYRDIGDRTGIGHSLSALGNAASLDRNYDKAKDYYEQSLEIRTEIGDQRTIADSLTDLMNVCLSSGDFVVAQRYGEQSLEIRQSIDDTQGILRSFLMLGVVSWFLNEPEKADAYLKQSGIDEANNLHGWSIIQGLAILGEIEFAKGNLDVAYRKYVDSISIDDVTMDNMPLLSRMYYFGLAGIAGVLAEQNKKSEALSIVTTLLNTPKHFVSYIADKIDALNERLCAELDADAAEEAIERGQEMTIQDYVGRYAHTETA